MSYLVWKYLHLLSAIVVMGTGAGIAFFMLVAYLRGSMESIAHTARTVVLADAIFTMPAVILLFTSGMVLAGILQIQYSSPWFVSIFAMFLFIGLCWLPVLVIQYRMQQEAERLLREGVSEKSRLLNDLMKAWVALGIPAFLTILTVLYFMVFKPLPWA